MQTGKLAVQYGLTRPLAVLKSQSGFYIGTVDANQGPVSRESEEYYLTQPEAEKTLENRSFTQREDV